MDDTLFSFRTAFIATPDHVNIRYGWFPSVEKSRGVVVLLNGRSEFLEKYREPVSLLNRRGFDVFSFDWRGQGLSTRLLPNPHKGFVRSFKDYLMDLETCMNQIVFPKSKGPVLLLGHSMGGHMALRYLHKVFSTDAGKVRGSEARITGVVLSSPMLDIHTRPYPSWLVRFLARVLSAVGFEDAYAPGSRDYMPEKQIFSGNLLTSDPVRYRDHIHEVEKDPNLAVGGVTFGWLAAACQSMDLLHQKASLAVIGLPVLMAGAECDRIVSTDAQRKTGSMLPDCKFILIKKARHEILKESDDIQASFWLAFDHFVKEIL
jgi:lysophospholipase